MKKGKLTLKHKAKPTQKPASKRARSEKLTPATVADVPAIVDEVSLISDLRSLIHAARQRVATVANSTQTMLYWSVGKRLLRENLQDSRAAYGKRILATVSQELTAEFGSGFTYTSLTRMVRFAESMVDEQIVAALSQQLSWSHFMEVLPIKDQLARDLYAEMCGIERWGDADVGKVAGIFQMPSAKTEADLQTENNETQADGTWDVPATLEISF